jgi:hypothetical protein
MDSVEDELTSFFGSLEISQSPDDIIANMNRDNITVKDLASMDRDDVYGYGVKTFKDAKRILERARSRKKLVKQGSRSQEERRPQLVRQESRDYGRAGECTYSTAAVTRSNSTFPERDEQYLTLWMPWVSP